GRELPTSQPRLCDELRIRLARVGGPLGEAAALTAARVPAGPAGQRAGAVGACVQRVVQREGDGGGGAPLCLRQQVDDRRGQSVRVDRLEPYPLAVLHGQHRLLAVGGRDGPDRRVLELGDEQRVDAR